MILNKLNQYILRILKKYLYFLILNFFYFMKQTRASRRLVACANGYFIYG